MQECFTDSKARIVEELGLEANSKLNKFGELMNRITCEYCERMQDLITTNKELVLLGDLYFVVNLNFCKTDFATILVGNEKGLKPFLRKLKTKFKIKKK